MKREPGETHRMGGGEMELGRYHRIAAIVVAAIMTAAAALPMPATAQRGTILTAVMGTFPTPLDPAIGAGGPHYRVFVNAYEGLLAYERGTVRLIPALAESWTSSADLTTFTFRIRRGVRFHDGTVLDAETVKLAFDRVKKIGMGPSVFLGKVREVQVVNPSTVRITLTQPSSTFLMGLPKVFITPKARATDADDGRAWFSQNVNGTGPFKVARMERDQFLLLQRHTEYWRGWPEQRLEGIMFRYGIDPATQKLMLERGEADMVEYYSFGPDVQPEALDRAPNVTIVRSPAFRTFIYALNTQKPNSPLRDRRVRRAFALAFDYDAMKEVFFGNAQVPNGFLPPGFAAHNPARPAFRRDVVAARRLMSEAGHAQGFDITCRFSGVEEQGRKLGLILQASLREINVRVTLEPNPPFAIFTAQMANLETAPICGGHRLMSPLTADAGAYMRQVFGANNTGKPFNDSWYANPEVERLLDEAERTSDTRRQVELWRQAESLIIEDQPVIFVAFATPIFEPVQERVANYLAHPLDYSGVFTYYPVYIRR